MSQRTRIFYRENPTAVVILKNGLEVATYKSTSEMIETHIKGILAKDHQDTKKVRDLLRKYRPDDIDRK